MKSQEVALGLDSIGLVYVASLDDRYVEEAFLSAESVRQRAPELPITLFTDRPDHPLCRLDVFSSVVSVEGCAGIASRWAEGQLIRLKALQKSPYARTLHLDTDTRILTAEIRGLFALLDRYDLAMVQTAIDDSYSRVRSGREMYNAGLALYRRNARTDAWLAEWIRLSERNFRMASQTPLPSLTCLDHINDVRIRRDLMGMDQISLLEIMSPDVNRFDLVFQELDYTWNHRGSRLTEKNAQPMRIKHWPVLKTTTRADILEVAFRWAQSGREQAAEALYDYIAQGLTNGMKRRWWATRGKKSPYQWREPLLRRADLHRGHRQFQEAFTLYEALFREKQDNAPALAGMGEIAAVVGRSEEGLAMLASAVEMSADDPAVLEAQGRTFEFLGRFSEALAPLRRAVRGGNGLAVFNLGQVLLSLGSYRKAADAYRHILRDWPVNSTAINNLLPALAGSRKYAALNKHADKMLKRIPWCVNALAFKSLALVELGRTAEEVGLFDRDRLVHAERIEAPVEFPTIAAFMDAVVGAITDHSSLRHAPAQHATRNGWHSGNLADSDDPAIAPLNRLAILAAETRRIMIAPESSHPFDRHAPTNYRLHSWVVIMHGGGHQIPHIHSSGWLSGVCYIQLPPSIGQGGDDISGWLRFGGGESRWHRPQTILPSKCVRPEVGTLVTFPSFFWHETIPMPKISGPRISYAFDIIPE